MDLMARPSTHDTALRGRLLEEAAELVDKEGPERVSLREIARAAGTSTSAVYALFGGKTELLAAVVEDAFASFGRAQEEAEPEGLRALGLAYRAWALRHPARYRLMFGGALAAAHEGVDPAVSLGALLPLARTLLGTATPPPEADLRATIAVWAQVHGAVSLELAGITPHHISPDVVYEAVLDGIAAAHPGR